MHIVRPCFKCKTNAQTFLPPLFHFSEYKGPGRLSCQCTLCPAAHYPVATLPQNTRKCTGPSLMACKQETSGQQEQVLSWLFAEVRSCYATLPALISWWSSCLSLLTAWITDVPPCWFGRGFKCLRVCGHVWRPEADPGISPRRPSWYPGQALLKP